jgi:hypothetical protein
VFIRDVTHVLRHLVVPTVTVALATLVTTVATADAAPRLRSVQAVVSVRNADAAPLKGWTLRARLAHGTRLRRAVGAKASGHTGAVTFTGTRTLAAGTTRTLTLTVRGASAPRGWSAGGRACTATHRARHGSTARLAIRCVLGGGAHAGGGDTTPGTTTAGSPAPAGGTPAAAGTPFRFAPYADMAAWPAPDLGDIRSHTGASHISLGFVVQSAAGGCDPTWGGYVAYPATGAGAYQGAAVHAFQQGGGDVVVSFGGASGTELALACTSAGQLAAAYQAVIDAYGATHVDFDIEGAALTNTAADTMRAQAIATLQHDAVAAGSTLTVSYTLPTDPTGLSADGVAVVRDAVADGVALSLVNLMTMDYGLPAASGQMAAYATQAGAAVETQLAAIFPASGAAQIARMVGLTPMIGINDQDYEVFTTQDAATVAAWATANHIGMLGMWSLGHDHPCPQTDGKCSGTPQSDWQFATTLGAFTG